MTDRITQKLRFLNKLSHDIRGQYETEEWYAPIAWTTSEGKIVYCNNEFEELFETSQKELLGKQVIFGAVTIDDRPTVFCNKGVQSSVKIGSQIVRGTVYTGSVPSSNGHDSSRWVMIQAIKHEGKSTNQRHLNASNLS